MIDYLRSKTEHEMGVVVVLSVAVICVCVSFQSSAILYCVQSPNFQQQQQLVRGLRDWLLYNIS